MLAVTVLYFVLASSQIYIIHWVNSNEEVYVIC